MIAINYASFEGLVNGQGRSAFNLDKEIEDTHFYFLFSLKSNILLGPLVSENLLGSPGLSVAEEGLGVDQRFSGELSHNRDLLRLVVLSPSLMDKTESMLAAILLIVVGINPTWLVFQWFPIDTNKFSV